MSITLCGAHRTGKSTLARTYAEKAGVPFVETSVSAIWREMGYDPSVTYDFGTRLMIQEEILKRVDAIYAKYAGADFITDRSPLDMAAYTLAEAIGERVPPMLQKRLANYIDACFDCTNKRFGIVLLVQPGIALVDEPGKAPLNEGYIEHLNSLILGLSVDERLKTRHFYMPRHVLDLEARVAALESVVRKCQERVFLDVQEGLKAGSLVVH